MDKQIEKRTIGLEFREVGDNDRTIEGRAIVFNSLSQDLGGFKEKISPDAVSRELIDNSDIFMLYNHDRSKGFLARSKYGKGTLSTEIRDDGVYFKFEAPNTELANEVMEHMKRGDIDQCSFAFTVEDDTWERQEDDSYIRTINSISRLYDFSIVDTPAYLNTECSCARFLEIQEADKKALEEQREKEEREAQEKRDNELKEYFENLRKENEKYLKADKQ